MAPAAADQATADAMTTTMIVTAIDVSSSNINIMRRLQMITAVAAAAAADMALLPVRLQEAMAAATQASNISSLNMAAAVLAMEATQASSTEDMASRSREAIASNREDTGNRKAGTDSSKADTGSSKAGTEVNTGKEEDTAAATEASVKTIGRCFISNESQKWNMTRSCNEE